MTSIVSTVHTYTLLRWKECVLTSVVDGDLTNLFLCSQRSGHVHVADAVHKGFRKVYVCTVNTHVMVLVIAAFELWIAFGTGSFIIMIPQKEFVLLESRLPCYHRL